MSSEETFSTIDEDNSLDVFVIDDEKEEANDSSPRSTLKSLSAMVGERHLRTIDEYFEDAYSTSTSRGLMKYWLIFITLGVANMGDSVELSSVGYLMANKDFQDLILHDNFSTNGSIVASVALAGMIIGGLVTGSFEGTLGRKRSLLGGLFLNGVACVFAAFAPNVAILSIVRFFVGLGIGTILSSLTAISAELSPPSQRGLFVTVVSGFYAFGMLYASAVANAIMGFMGLSWRVFIGVTTIPTIISVLTVWLIVPDSPRFLALHGNFEAAARCANQVSDRLEYQGRRFSVEEVKFFFHCKENAHLGERDAVKDVDTADENDAEFVVEEGETSSLGKALSNISAMYCKTLRNRTISLQLLWISLEMGTGLGSFINVIFEEAGQGAYVGLTVAAIGNLFGSLLGAIYLDEVGRKSSIALTLIVSSGATLGAAWVVNGDINQTIPLVLFILMFSGLTSLAWNANMTLSAEMFPTKVRSTGLGYVAATGRIASIVQQFINGSLVAKPVILLVVISAAQMIGASAMLVLRTDDMARQPLSDAVSTGKTKRDESRSDFVIVPINKEAEVSRKYRPGEIQRSDEVPPMV